MARTNANVNQQITDWTNGKLKGSAILELGNPSDILRGFVITDLLIHLTQSILTKAINKKHDVNAADLHNLVLNVQAPIAVFKSKRGADSLVQVTEARHANGNIVVAFQLETSRDGIEINDIRSIHPRFDHSIASWIEGGLLLGYEKSKGHEWLENSAASNSQQPQVKATFDQTLYTM